MRPVSAPGSALVWWVAVLAVGCGDSGRQAGQAGATEAEAQPGTRVFSGAAATIAGGDACTTKASAGGDSWCAFVARASGYKDNLFVVNVSRVLAGVPVSCNAPDPNCLLLTEDLGPTVEGWHRTFFGGDTLVYYDATLTPYVWRPGMGGGRLLANRSDALDISFCAPAPHGTALACLGFPTDQGSEIVSVVTSELYTGTIDGESEPLLTPIDTVIAATRADLGGVHRFSFGFPADGYVTWTTREDPEGPEILKLERVGEPESRITVASDVHAWDVSPDGTAWVWLRAADERGVGVLQVAPFPDGTDPRDLLADVWDYGLDRNGSLVTLTDTGDLTAFRDPMGAPDERLLIDSGVQALVTLGDQGHLAYAKHYTTADSVDLFVSKLDGTEACTLETSVTVPARSVHFSPGTGTALWARANTDGYDAYHSRLADCSTDFVAPGVVVLGWMGHGNTVFMDDFDSPSSSGTLRFRGVGTNGKLNPTPPTLIAEHVDYDATFGSALIYTVNTGGDEDGLYVRGFAE